MTHQPIDEFLRASAMFVPIRNELHAHSRLWIRCPDNSLQETFEVRHAHTQKHRRVHRERIARLQIARIGGNICQAPPAGRERRCPRFNLGCVRASCTRRGSLFNLPIRRGIFDSPKISGNIRHCVVLSSTTREASFVASNIVQITCLKQNWPLGSYTSCIIRVRRQRPGRP